MKHVIFFWVCFFFGISTALALPQFACLEMEKMEVSISHPTKYLPFLKNTLILKKNRCIIDIELKKYSYLQKVWRVDVCRGPIHIKYGASYSEVFKKRPQDGLCEASSGKIAEQEAEGAFCPASREILDTIQDRGLVFAEGERDDMTSEHGKFYCLYSLLGHYFQKDFIFSLIKNVTPQEPIPDSGMEVPESNPGVKEDTMQQNPLQNPLKEQEANAL